MKRFDADRIIAVSAMLVGLVSVHLSPLANSQQGVEVLLTNSGIGPAIVDDVQVHYQGKDIAADPYDFFMGLNEENRKNGAGVDKVQRGRLIPAGTTVHMLSFAPGPNGTLPILPMMLRLFDIADVPKEWYSQFGPHDLQHGVIEVRYSSVYGEHWRIRSDRVVPDAL